MKKIISAILVWTLVSLTATAQNENRGDRPDHGEMRQNYNRISSRLLDQLSLTATQSEQIKVINDDYRNKMQDMIKSDIAVEDRKARRNSYDAERRTKILAILTPTQIRKLHELQKAGPDNDDKDGDYKIKTKSEDGEKIKVKVKKDEK